jgi:hypothetical protein
VRAGDAACPFCGVALASSPAPSRTVAAGRRPRSRAALLFAVAAVAAGCGGSTEPTSTASDGGQHDAASDSGGYNEPDAFPVTMYGPGPINVDGGTGDAATDVDSGGGLVMYGPAPIDDDAG